MNSSPEELFNKGVEQFNAEEYCNAILFFKESVKHGYNYIAAESFIKEARLKCRRGCFFKFPNIFLRGFRVSLVYILVALAPFFILPLIRRLFPNYSTIQVDIQIYFNWLGIILCIITAIFSSRNRV